MHGELEEFLVSDPVKLELQRVQLAPFPWGFVVRQHQVEEGHEMALAGAEGPVQIGRLAHTSLERLAGGPLLLVRR